MKKIALLLSILFIFVLFTAACSAKAPTGEDAETTQSSTDSADAETDTDMPDVQISGEGDNFVISDGEGNTVSVSADWPTGKVADMIPKFDKGTLLGNTTTNDACSIIFDKVAKNDYQDYVKKVKDAGFSENPTEMSSESYLYWQATNKDGATMVLSYDGESEQMSVVCAIETE